MRTFFIFYVSDQNRSTDFYRTILEIEPTLHVPGMTEFNLPDGARLGLMPNSGIRKILGDKSPDPATGVGIPRAEIYLFTENPAAKYQLALKNGATPVQPLQLMNWGDKVAYCLDPDGHVLAFAEDVSLN